MQRVLTLPGLVLFFYNCFVYLSGVRYRVTITDIDASGQTDHFWKCRSGSNRIADRGMCEPDRFAI